MLKRLLTLTIAVTLFACAKNDSQFHMPAEFEEQDAVWFGWTDHRGFDTVVANVMHARMPTCSNQTKAQISIHP